MSCPTFLTEIAQALGKETILPTDLLLISDNGTAYRVTVADLIAALGTTGALQPVNAPGAVPILSGAAPTYNISAIQGGNGVSAQLTGQGAISLSANVDNAGGSDDGEGLIVSPNAQTIEWRRLRAGQGITIEQDGDRLVVSNSEIAQASKTVVVNTIEDLPDAVSGVIALADNTDYLIANDITSPSRFVMGSNTVVRSVDPTIVTLTYTGNLTMFTMADGNQVIKEISLSAPTGRLFSNNASTVGSFVMRFVRVLSCLQIGDLSKPNVTIDHIIFDTISGSVGFEYVNGADLRLSITQVTVNQASNAAFTFLDLGAATFTGYTLQQIELFNTVSGQTFLEGLTGGANIPGPTAIALISNVEIEGDMQALQGVAYGDPGYDFITVDKVGTTKPIALVYLSAANTTLINTQSVPEKVEGTFVQQVADYYTTDVSGRVTLVGKRDRIPSLTASFTARPVSGTSTFTFFLAKNGTIIPESGITREISSGAVGAITITWAEQLQTNDFLEVFVQNDTSSTNVQFQKLVLRVD